MSYEEMLARGMKAVPKKIVATERFTVPRAQVMKAGARTVIINFMEIANALRREPAHLLKFLLKELATKGDVEKTRLTVLGNFTADQIDKKVEFYVKTYVMCSECGKPDTKMVREDRYYFLVCEACGAKHSLG
jgi:translation initiation factor 2 subunit 2